MAQADTERTGPFVGAAFLCEQIITDDSGVMSVIRIIDRITQRVAGPDPPSEMPPFKYNVKGLVLLKDGAARGRHNIQFRIEHPSGVRLDVGRHSVVFEGRGHGTNIKLDLQLQLSGEGLYWIDVLLEDELLTRIPLDVRYEITQVPQVTPG